jgi:hypothetical protein
MHATAGSLCRSGHLKSSSQDQFSCRCQVGFRLPCWGAITAATLGGVAQGDDPAGPRPVAQVPIWFKLRSMKQFAIKAAARGLARRLQP